MNTSSSFRSRLPLVALVAAAGLFGLTACAGAAATTTSDDTATETGTAEQPPTDAGQARGVSGLVAAASDGLLQVQSTSSDGESEQTAVTYTSETTVTSEITGSLADVAVGSCVTITTGTDEDAVATTVRITAAVDGACTTAFGGGGMGGAPDGERPEGAPDGAPTGAPTDGERPEGAPTGAPEGMGGGGFGGMTAGLVTAVDGTTITVESTGPEDEDATTTTVTVDDATTYTTTVDADASALAAGVCVTAQGEADESGGFAATSLAVSAAVDGACSTGFGGGRGMGLGEATS